MDYPGSRGKGARSMTAGARCVDHEGRAVCIWRKRSRKAVVSAISSRSGSCKQMSMTCAPAFTWSRPPHFSALSQSPEAMRALKARLPGRWVRSPTRTGRFSCSTSREIDARGSSGGGRHLAWACNPHMASAKAPMMWAGVAAAAAHEVHPAFLRKAPHLLREDLGVSG